MRQDDIDPSTQLLEREQRTERDKQTVQRETEDIIWLMSEQAGRRIIAGLLEESGVYRSSYAGDDDTFFREGRRAIGLKYLAVVSSHCPDDYILMLKERRDDVDRNRSAR